MASGFRKLHVGGKSTFVQKLSDSLSGFRPGHDMSGGQIPGRAAVGDVYAVFRVPCGVSALIGDDAVAAAEGALQIVRDFLNRFALGKLVDDVHPAAVLIPGETEDLIEHILRDGHRKRNGRFKGTHSFVNKRYLLALGREKGELLAGSRLLVQL